MIGTPRLMAAGTSRELGIWIEIGTRRVFSTSLRARPTLESERLRTTAHFSRGKLISSRVSSVSLRFFSAGMSRVAISAIRSLWSSASSTCSSKAGGVSTTT